MPEATGRRRYKGERKETAIAAREDKRSGSGELRRLRVHDYEIDK